jgi:hypothetical protein
MRCVFASYCSACVTTVHPIQALQLLYCTDAQAACHLSASIVTDIGAYCCAACELLTNFFEFFCDTQEAFEG